MYFLILIRMAYSDYILKNSYFMIKITFMYIEFLLFFILKSIESSQIFKIIFLFMILLKKILIALLLKDYFFFVYKLL